MTRILSNIFLFRFWLLYHIICYIFRFEFYYAQWPHTHRHNYSRSWSWTWSWKRYVEASSRSDCVYYKVNYAVVLYSVRILLYSYKDFILVILNTLDCIVFWYNILNYCKWYFYYIFFFYTLLHNLILEYNIYHILSYHFTSKSFS